MEIALRVHVVRRIFTIFSPYESALRTDDGSVPYFLICQGMLPWQPK